MTPVPLDDGNAASDLDWWYTPAGALLDAERLPANRLAGTITAGALTTTPGPARVNLLLSGVPASFAVSQLAISFASGASSAPLASSGFPPGHLAAEQLDPTLQSFATAGELSLGVPTGRMCGNISALSMAQTPMPPALVGTCAGYTVANTLLDLLVSGCPGAVAASPQPDQEDPDAPPAGAGPPYMLTADAITKQVTNCFATGGGPAVSLPVCLADAAYSSHFRFLSQRVIARDDLIFEDGFETVI